MNYKRLSILRLLILYWLALLGLTQNPVIARAIVLSASTGQDHAISQKEMQNHAQALWEQAIAAKGGRERLYNLRSILVNETRRSKPVRIRVDPDGQVSSKQLKATRSLLEELLVLPDKVWIWDKDSSSYLGLNVFMRNYETNIGYWLQGGDPKDGYGPMSESEGLIYLRETKTLIPQLLYLMETKWVKPTPISVSTGEVAGRMVDIVQTEVEARSGRLVNGKMRVDFSLDKETHLPIKIDFYRKSEGMTEAEQQRKGLLKDEYSLAEYTEMSGVRIPVQVDFVTVRWQWEKMGVKLPPPAKAIVQLNVDYDENIFSKPIQIEKGPDVWRKKS